MQSERENTNDHQNPADRGSEGTPVSPSAGRTKNGQTETTGENMMNGKKQTIRKQFFDFLEEVFNSYLGLTGQGLGKH